MGAGCIIKNQNKILALVLPTGELDFPKGHSEAGEDPFTTAQRETWEECGLWVTQDQVRGFVQSKNLVMYITEWDGTPPRITPNPETGMLEHVSWDWATAEDFQENCLSYLVQLIDSYIIAISNQ